MMPPESLVHHEARLLDRRDYARWLQLFAEECRYWVPVSPELERPEDGPSHFLDDRQLMLARTHRLTHPRAFGAEPPPRTLHVVSGVDVEIAGDEARALSSQIMLEWRPRGGFEADQRMFGGEVRHHLRRHGQRWEIVEKRVDLVGAEGSFAAILAPI